MDEILKHANLLSYSKKFYAQGIESPHEVLRAMKTKEDFAEIVRMVGMASSPGHVLRFKTAMQDWANEQGWVVENRMPASKLAPIEIYLSW